MSDAKASEKGDRQDRAPDQVRAPDAQDARVAGAGDLKAAHALNRNAHSGSAGGDQEHSIELVMPKKDGGYDLLAARVMTPDSKKVASDRPPEPKPPRPSDWEDQMNTGAIISAEAKKNPAVEPVALLKNWAEKLPDGAEKQAYKQLAREQLAQVSPEAKQKLDAMDEKRRLIAQSNQDEAGSFNIKELREQAALQGRVEEQKILPENEWRAFSQLSPNDRKVVIDSLMKCPEAITTDYNKQLSAVAWAFPKGAANFATHTFEAFIGLGQSLAKINQFAEDIKTANPRAIDTALEAYREMGKAAATGQDVCNMGLLYAGDLRDAAARGDTSKIFRDVSWLGEQIDLQWSQKSEAEKVEIATEFSLGMAIPGGIAAIAKSERLTVSLMQIAKLLPEEQLGKYAEAWAGLRKTLGPKLVPQVSEGPNPSDIYMAMSKADDFSTGGKAGRLLLLGKDGTLVKFEKLKHLEISETVGDVSNTHWTGANFLTGWKVEGTLKDKFMAAGEALPNSFPAIDGWSVEKGLVTSIKSIELRAPTYQDMEKFEERVATYLQELESYDGTRGPVLGHWIKSERINQKVLHLAIPDGSISSEQKKVLEKLAEDLEKRGSDTRIRLTALR